MAVRRHEATLEPFDFDGADDVHGSEAGEAGRDPAFSAAHAADPSLLEAVGRHMGQPWASEGEVLAILRDEYLLRVHEDGMPDSEESWQGFLEHWARWAGLGSTRH